MPYQKCYVSKLTTASRTTLTETDSVIDIGLEVLLMRTHNICFHGGIKYQYFWIEKSILSRAMHRLEGYQD